MNAWRNVNPDVTGFGAMAMTSPASDPGSVYVATMMGFQRSDDGGATWAQRSVPPCQVHTMAVAQSTPAAIYIGCQSSGGGVLKSTDGGATWTHVNQGLTPVQYPDQTPQVQAIAVDPVDPSTLYVATWADNIGDIFASHDAGATWTPIHTGPYADSVVVSGGRIYAWEGGANGIITSDDQGATWSQPAAVDATEALVADPADPDTVYAIENTNNLGGVSVTTDGGQTWTPVPNAPARIYSSATTAGRLYLGTLSGVSMTTDGGQSWVSTGTHVGGDYINAYAVAPDPTTSGHVWVGTDHEGLWDVSFDQTPAPGFDPYWISSTTAATDVTPTAATLNGVVAATAPSVVGHYSFEWGTTTGYGQTTSFADFPAATQDGVDSPVSATITNLTPDTTYHFQLVGYANWWSYVSSGKTTDLTFTTPPAAAPTVSAPTVGFRRARVGDGPYPVRIGWHAGQGTYPICSIRLRRSTDGGPFRSVPLPSLTTRRVDATVIPGHQYRFRVKAADCSGGASGWQETFFRVSRYGGRPQITFSAAWKAADHGMHTTSKPGASATFHFVGDAVALTALKGRGCGKAAVYLDGVEVATVDLRANQPTQRRLVFHHTFPTRDEHTLVVRAILARHGAHLTIDSLIVAG